MVGGRACGENITVRRSNLLKVALSVCLCACDTVFVDCNITWQRQLSGASHCVGNHFDKIEKCKGLKYCNTVHTLYCIKCPFQVVGWEGDQFSDRCLYTTYRCRRNSEWLPWRLTTTHRSRQGNRKNIINKGTNNPRNKRNLDARPSPPLPPCEIKTWQQ